MSRNGYLPSVRMKDYVRPGLALFSIHTDRKIANESTIFRLYGQKSDCVLRHFSVRRDVGMIN